MIRFFAALLLATAFCFPAAAQFEVQISGRVRTTGLGFPPESSDNGGREEIRTFSVPGASQVRLANAGGSGEASASARVGEGYYILSASANKTGFGGFTASAFVEAQITGTITTDGPARVTYISNAGASNSGSGTASISHEDYSEATEITPGLDPIFAFASVDQSIVNSRSDSAFAFWGAGDPGPTGFNHMPGGRSDNPIAYTPPRRGFIPPVPDDEFIFEEGRDPQMVAGINFTFPAMQGYGLGNPVFVATQSAGENPIAELSLLAAATAPEPEVIAYEFVAPENGFTFFEIVESLIDDTEFTVTAGDTELPISEGGSIGSI